MSDDTLLARLSAADPLPEGAGLDDHRRERLLRRVLAAPPERRPARTRRIAAVAAATAAVAVPAAAFAGQIGGFLGLSNEGAAVQATAVVGADAPLARAMGELHFPAQIADLGERAGFHFYVTRNAGGDFCFAISAAGAASSDYPKVVGCAPEGYFPSTAHPLLDFSTGAPNGGDLFPPDGRHFVSGQRVTRLLGFAADGVSTVALLDAEGRTLASAPVVGNVYAEPDVPPVPVAALVARDGAGGELYRIG